MENVRYVVKFVWGNSVKAITWVSILFFVIIVYFLMRSFIHAHFYETSRMISFVSGVLIVFIFIYLLYLCPRYLLIENNTITIKKIIGKVTIQRKMIKQIRPLDSESMKNTIRVLGSGGMMGYLGKFKNPELGSFEMYATEWDHFYLIELFDGKKIVISYNNLLQPLDKLI